MRNWKETCVFTCAALAVLNIAGCGGGSTVPTQKTTYTIGGTVTGLAGTGLVLQDNGGNSLTVSASGNFIFSTAVASGGVYAVTVSTQPSAQHCTVTNGNGTASANVTNVQVACVSLYTIGGTVSGLSAKGLVLQDNGGDNLTVNANGAFTFSTAIASGGAYAVSIHTEPSIAQSCAVTNGSGTASANVTNVQVACTTEWVWMGGSDKFNQPNGVNTPGGRTYPATWTDASGNLWLFGGSDYDSSGNEIDFNDLWKYNLASGEWTEMSGSGSVPGIRDLPATWTDSSGNLWLFGGYLQATGDFLNDLWKYTPSSGEWTLMGGSSTLDVFGIYGGTPGVYVQGNYPGARTGSASWTDSSGNFWLFGGNGCASESCWAFLNDLWTYNPSNGQWIWMGPSNSNEVQQIGKYGAPGISSSDYYPGARCCSTSWIDSSGDFWLFGGNGNGSSVSSTKGDLNDLWKYTQGTGQGAGWAYMTGSEGTNSSGTYAGTPGVYVAGNLPGARQFAAGWTDLSGNLWLFGGYNGLDFNDLWEYNPSSSQGGWTWMGGSSSQSQLGKYAGTAGVATAGNFPGARDGAAAWTDSSGNFWLFGGEAQDPASGGAMSTYNDLWEY